MLKHAVTYKCALIFVAADLGGRSFHASHCGSLTAGPYQPTSVANLANTC